MTCTKQNERRTCDAFLQCRNNALSRELVLQRQDMLPLIAEHANDIGMQTRIQQTNCVNFVRPIVSSVEMTPLTAVAKFTTTKLPFHNWPADNLQLNAKFQGNFAVHVRLRFPEEPFVVGKRHRCQQHRVTNPGHICGCEVRLVVFCLFVPNVQSCSFF